MGRGEEGRVPLVSFPRTGGEGVRGRRRTGCTAEGHAETHRTARRTKIPGRVYLKEEVLSVRVRVLRVVWTPLFRNQGNFVEETVLYEVD